MVDAIMANAIMIAANADTIEANTANADLDNADTANPNAWPAAADYLTRTSADVVCVCRRPGCRAGDTQQRRSSQ